MSLKESLGIIDVHCGLLNIVVSREIVKESFHGVLVILWAFVSEDLVVFEEQEHWWVSHVENLAHLPIEVAINLGDVKLALHDWSESSKLTSKLESSLGLS